MAITNTFKECVKKGEVQKLHIMMCNSLLIDYSFSEFNEMEKLARNVPGLYDKQNDTVFIEDKTKWNDDYMHRVDAELEFNFSHERIAHLKQVIQYLHPENEEDKSNNIFSGNTVSRKEKNDERPLSYQEQKRQDQQEGRIIKIVSGAAVGGVAGGVISGVTGGSVIAGAVVGAVVVGGVVVLATKQK